MSNSQQERNIKDLIATPDSSCKEFTLERVMETVMRMTLKVADATGGQLLLVNNGSLRVRARAWLERDVVIQIEAFGDDDALVWTIANAVTRTGQAIALDTASEVDQMLPRHDAPARLPRSAYCLPLYCGELLVAVLYLENYRIEHAFPESARSLLDLLASQAAIVLEDMSAQAARLEMQHGENLEGELRQVRFELSQASRVSAIDALVASITHEMSQPLSAIDASSSAGLRWLQRDTPNLEEAVISLEKVRSCAMRARKIIDDLRALKSELKIPSGEFDIHSAIREVVRLSRPRIDELGASVVFTGMTAAQHVMGDRVQIQQVIEHLIMNALESMAEVTNRARIIRISTTEADDELLIVSVADSGPGVAPEWEEKLFRPFATTKTRGMGMGLPICKGIIEAHGGSMWIETVRPFGLRFCFTLDRIQHDHTTS